MTAMFPPAASVAPEKFMTLREMTQSYVAHALRVANGDKTAAAKLLGVNRRTIYRILARQAASGET